MPSPAATRGSGGAFTGDPSGGAFSGAFPGGHSGGAFSGAFIAQGTRGLTLLRETAALREPEPISDTIQYHDRTAIGHHASDCSNRITILIPPPP